MLKKQRSVAHLNDIVSGLNAAGINIKTQPLPVPSVPSAVLQDIEVGTAETIPPGFNINNYVESEVDLFDLEV